MGMVLIVPGANGEYPRPKEVLTAMRMKSKALLEAVFTTIPQTEASSIQPPER
jgi:hypothetical protein